ncbi:MAG TPA: DUF4199 domain-containing protein [Vicinamibacterales bacterium]|nr:DUF4199 domain-containing protein [Vicinamibacterales bacterium]
MNPILNTGLLIGIACAVWTFVMGVTGWYKDPALIWLFFAVIVPIQVLGIAWGLRQTAAEGRGYTNQIVAGAMISIVAGVIIIVSSLLFTTVAFPDYFQELADVNRELLRQQGKSPAEIEETVKSSMAGASAMGHALQGFLGTLVTGILASAVIAIFFRARGSRT